MSRQIPTLDSLRADPNYRWNDNITDAMSHEELWKYLVQEAKELDRVREVECSYGVFREIVWRYPDRSAAWEGLAKYALKMGFGEEAQIAGLEAGRLKSVSGVE